VFFFFSTRVQQASATTAKIPWLPTHTVIRHFTHTLWYSHLGHGLTGERAGLRESDKATDCKQMVCAG
jgi:hypothetical protein